MVGPAPAADAAEMELLKWDIWKIFREMHPHSTGHLVIDGCLDHLLSYYVKNVYVN